MPNAMPPVAQFSLPQPGQQPQASEASPASVPGMPPIAQFSLPASAQSSGAQSQGETFTGDLSQGNYGGAAVKGLENTANFVAPSLGDVGAVLQGKHVGLVKALADAGITGLDALMFIPGLQPEDLAAQAGLRGLTASVAGNVAAGAGIGALNSVAQGGGASGAVTGGLLGGLTGGAAGVLAPAFSKYISSVPLRLTQSMGKDMTEASARQALTTKTIGTAGSLMRQAEASALDYNGKVGAILASDPYIENVGKGAQSLIDTLSEFPNSRLVKTTDDVANQVKKVVPNEARLVDKVADGTATLADKNSLRASIDTALYPKKGVLTTDKLIPSKGIAYEFANHLRQEVQTVAPETAPLFKQWSNELGFAKALKLKKGGTLMNLPDILTAIGGGLATGNPFLGIAGSATLDTARSPLGKFALAKGLQKTMPGIMAAGNLARAVAPRVPGLLSSSL